MRGFDYMSASSKKKLRNEQQTAKKTKKQVAEQKEAKKLTLYTTIFVVVLAVMVVFAIAIGVTRSITNSGVHELQKKSCSWRHNGSHQSGEGIEQGKAGSGESHCSADRLNKNTDGVDQDGCAAAAQQKATGQNDPCVMYFQART